MRGYKAFDKDFACRGFQYDVGNNYETEEKIALCEAGFHFCKKIADCFDYYAKAGVWETRDGEKVRVEDMTTSHIVNAIAFIRRNDTTDWYQPWIVRFEKELERREG